MTAAPAKRAPSPAPTARLRPLDGDRGDEDQPATAKATYSQTEGKLSRP